MHEKYYGYIYTWSVVGLGSVKWVANFKNNANGERSISPLIMHSDLMN